VLAVSLVAIIGLAGLLMLFKELSPTGHAVRISDQTIAGCSGDEILLSAVGVEAIKTAGRHRYGPDFSPYTSAHISYNGVGYCADAEVVRELLGDLSDYD